MHSQSGSDISALLELEKDVSVTVAAEQNPFVEVKERIHWTRQHVWKYNALLCAVLLVIWLSRVIQALGRRRKVVDIPLDQDSGEDTGSDSSSTLTGTATPPDVKRNHDIEDEETPLLPRSSEKRPSGFWSRLSCKTTAFLIYQPRPLPVIHKTLPDNGTTLFILTFVVLNCVLCIVNIPFKSSMWMVFGDRCANLFSANLPLLYLLAAKNQPLKFLTGFSYEALNIFHRRLGELLCFFALMHMATTFIMYYTLLKPLLADLTLWHFICEPLILMGILAFVCYETLYFTSLGSFRQRWYELFLASHILLQASGLAFLWFHYFNSKLYVLSAVVIFLVDRLVFRLMVNTTTVNASVEVLEDGETVMLSADWAITGQRPLFLGRRSIKHGWEPAAHVFVTVPALSKSAVLQAHPFTIAAAAPDLTAAKPYAWLNLLIRAHDGFSRDLLKHAQSHSKVYVRFDGPYGSLEPLHMLEAAEHAVLVAGGSGIAVVLPLIWALLHHPTASAAAITNNDDDDDDAGDAETLLEHKHGQKRQKVTLIWIMHSASHASWMPQERLDELAQLGLDVRIPPPTATHGRPDVGAMVQDTMYAAGNSTSQHGGGSTRIVVSGPDALNRDVRNTCSRLVGEGADINITVEKFGW